MRGTPLLSVENVVKTFGGVKALDGCSLTIEKGVCTGIIGPNGSGKTTLLNVINGFHKPDSGRVYLNGRRIDKLPPSTICRLGVGRVFQVTKLFNGMTVLENVMVEAVWMKKNLNAVRERALELLRDFGIPLSLKDELAGRLSGGQQKLVDLARALVADPEILLLDEPLAGVHAAIKEKIMKTVNELVREGKTVVFVSHDIPSIMKVAQDVVFMSAGKVLVRGRPDEIRSHEEVITAYLGV